MKLEIKQIIVMGVSGCGKSTLAHALADRLGWLMIEGDDYHPASNIAKMAANTPLTDADRTPWLRLLNTELKKRPHVVLSCSALKASYRDLLRSGISNTMLVHPHADFDTLLARTQARQAQGEHFMPATLLQSQFDTLELPLASESCITVSCEESTDAQLMLVLRALKEL